MFRRSTSPSSRSKGPCDRPLGLRLRRGRASEEPGRVYRRPRPSLCGQCSAPARRWRDPAAGHVAHRRLGQHVPGPSFHRRRLDRWRCLHGHHRIRSFLSADIHEGEETWNKLCGHEPMNPTVEQVPSHGEDTQAASSGAFLPGKPVPTPPPSRPSCRRTDANATKSSVVPCEGGGRACAALKLEGALSGHG